MQEKALIGELAASVDEYNLLEVVTVYIGDDGNTDNHLLKMLDKIFSNTHN